MSSPSQPDRYFHAWMLLRTYDLIELFDRYGFIPEGPIEIAGVSRNGRVSVRFIAEYVNDPSIQPTLPALIPPPPPTQAQLSEAEQRVEAVVGYEWMHIRTIARLADYQSLSHLRGIIARLCLTERLERGPKGTYRKRRSRLASG
ncbi:MAG: hypothetical protein K2R98_28410 [Gemmataceae bacterium]|nr:hypothetical protein [Gemmataceae bacterium]